MKFSHNYFCRLFFTSTLLAGTVLSSTLANAATYQLSAIQTNFSSTSDWQGNPLTIVAAPNNNQAIGGTMTIEGDDVAMSLNIATRFFDMITVYSGDSGFSLSGTNINFNSTVYYDSYYDFGGYGSYVYEYDYTYEAISGGSYSDEPVTVGGTGPFGPAIIAILGDVIVDISISDIMLSGYERSYSYSYDDEDQTGTPTIDGFEAYYDNDPFLLTLTVRDSTTNDFLLSEQYSVSYNEVPIPAAGWLFASALGLLGFRIKKSA